MKNNQTQSIRLFGNFMESLTHVHPITPLFLGPIILWFFYRSFHADAISIEMFILVAVFFYLFGLYKIRSSPVCFITKQKADLVNISFLLWDSCDDPNDKTRLVMPPVPAVIIVSALYLCLSNCPSAVFKCFHGVVFDWYLIYDNSLCNSSLSDERENREVFEEMAYSTSSHKRAYSIWS